MKPNKPFDKSHTSPTLELRSFRGAERGSDYFLALAMVRQKIVRGQTRKQSENKIRSQYIQFKFQN